ncbi:MAG: hypothetical protein R3D02_12470 [Hyphomicrobiales bacterium]
MKSSFRTAARGGDGTETIADAAGCTFVRGPAGRGGQLARSR